jgi:hypothetical protein
MNSISQAEAYRLFSEWYEYCLDNGVEPESIVENFGEMRLITDAETIAKFENFLSQ